MRTRLIKVTSWRPIFAIGSPNRLIGIRYIKAKTNEIKIMKNKVRKCHNIT